MKKLIVLSTVLLLSALTFGQNNLTQEQIYANKKLVRTYGALPTANKSMHWVNNNTPSETYVGVIKDSSASASEIVEAFMTTFQPLQDANILTKQMQTLSTAGYLLSSTNREANKFLEPARGTNRNQYGDQRTWTVQFIDGVRTIRFYYNVTVQAKDGRYKLTVTPSGISGFKEGHIQTQWVRLFNKQGKVKGLYSKYYNNMKIKLAFTIDQWIKKVAKESNQSNW